MFCNSGVTEGKGDGIDGAYPTTKEEFDTFRESLKNKILQFEVNPFVIFVLGLECVMSSRGDRVQFYLYIHVLYEMVISKFLLLLKGDFA